MLLAICEKNWQFLHQLATILGPAPQGVTPMEFCENV